MPATSTSERTQIGSDYAAALHAFLRHRDEAALQRAYEIGRRAVDEGTATVELVELHARAMSDVLARAGTQAVEQVLAGAQFLAECLAPYEMVMRGFRDSLRRLHDANAELSTRALELGAANDTIRRMARERTAFLAEASRQLASTLDYEATLQLAADVAVPRLAEWAVVEVWGARGVRVASREPPPPTTVLAAAPQGMVPAEVEDVSRRLEPGGEAAIPAATTTLAATTATPVTSGDASRATPEEPEVRVVAFPPEAPGAQPAQAMVVPLLVHGRPFGALLLGGVPGAEDPGGDEVAIAEELGRRVTQAIEHARLYREAGEAIRTRDEFLSLASHELKTPLTPLQLIVQQIQRSLAAGREVAPSVLGRALQSIRRLHALVEELLDVGLLQAGRLECVLEELDLGELVREHAELLMDGAPARQLSLDAPATPVIVMGDPFRLEQVLANLLDNAFKYGMGGPVALRLAVEGDQAVLTVRDDGIGIPSEQQAMVFERYFRARNASVKHYGGLGLGLHICHAIIEQHGGAIEIKSEVGQGSTFTVRLPLLVGGGQRVTTRGKESDP